MGEDLKEFPKDQRSRQGRPGADRVRPRDPIPPQAIRGRPPKEQSREDRVPFSLAIRRDLLERLRAESRSRGLRQCQILESALVKYFLLED